MANKFGGKRKIITTIISFLLLLSVTFYLFDRENTKSAARSNKATDTIASYFKYLNYTEIYANSTGDAENKNDTSIKMNLPLEILALEDFSDYEVSFFLAKDTLVHVHCAGEAADYFSNPFLFKSWDNDGVEVFFDMNNDKDPFFDINKDDRQYRVLWKLNQIDGQNVNKNGVRISEINPTATSYRMDLTFPWKNLGYVIPKSGLKIGFDVAIMDSDGESRKALVNWNSKSEDSWKNTSLYGTLILANSAVPIASGDALAVHRTTEPFLNAPSYKIDNVTVGYVKNNLDLSGKYCAEWDRHNLYLRIFVEDNVKSFSKALFDYGWIEDAEHNIFWKMDADNAKHGGGATKNKIVDTAIFLKKGLYHLKYHTDESHSPYKWDAFPPDDSFYGIRLSYDSLK